MMLTSLWQRGRTIWDKPQSRRIIVGGMLAAALAVILITIVRDWRSLVTYDWQFDAVYLGLSSVAYTGSLAVAVIAWGVVMSALNVRVGWRDHGRFFLYSWMARRLPTPAPFVASRVLLYEQVGVARRMTLLGMLWEQILLIASGGLLVVMLFPLTPLLNGNIPLLPVALVALVSLVVAVRPMLLVRLLNLILKRWKREPLTQFLGLPATLLVVGLHMLVWLSGGLILFFLVRSIYLIEWSMLPVLVQIWVASGLVGALSFLIPIGFSFRDLSMVVLLTLIVPLSVALIIALLMRVWITLNELFWALVFSRW
ncbi:hypothetical protein [Candidatus Chloroploca asiatica]|uniref:Lysylphosphatidylglycerol synthetase n=1 Tax=Candidatus Chloroploca asiatica TaxID=1506545 RepID=A0A2H3KLC5_9CHLR|nr:hypothetical protein [Candidatus Chloroploca asiatica]PDV98851.1 hypothetical protein A9Q02_02655 [Candidatus Chloroploca asiatica]